jgi:hypothetical protein
MDALLVLQGVARTCVPTARQPEQYEHRRPSTCIDLIGVYEKVLAFSKLPWFCSVVVEASLMVSIAASGKLEANKKALDAQTEAMLAVGIAVVACELSAKGRTPPDAAEHGFMKRLSTEMLADALRTQRKVQPAEFVDHALAWMGPAIITMGKADSALQAQVRTCCLVSKLCRHHYSGWQPVMLGSLSSCSLPCCACCGAATSAPHGAVAWQLCILPSATRGTCWQMTAGGAKQLHSHRCGGRKCKMSPPNAAAHLTHT